MNTGGYIWLPLQTAAPAPSHVTTYLVQQGWEQEESDDQWATFKNKIAGETVTIQVPQRGTAIDYPRAFQFFLQTLAQIEERNASAVLRDLKASNLDIIRLKIESGITRDGRIPIEAGRRLYEAARNIYLSAACSVLDPKPVFPTRKPGKAMELLNRARFGQTEVGSFVLTIESTIAPQVQQTLTPYMGDPDAPLERKTTILLAQALQATEQASRDLLASGLLAPFTTQTAKGVSANLCEAVAEAIEATEATALTASFSFAARRLLTAKVPKRVVFSSDTALILKEAAANLRSEATYPDTEVIGPVVNLKSSDSTQGGEATLKVKLEGKYHSVQVTLPPKAYKQAIQAHKNRQLVQMTGELAREGRSRVLLDARNISLLPDDDD